MADDTWPVPSGFWDRDKIVSASKSMGRTPRKPHPSARAYYELRVRCRTTLHKICCVVK
jgi:hypothetical protein